MGDVLKVVEWLGAYPGWVRILVGGWVLYTAVGVLILIFAREPAKEPKTVDVAPSSQSANVTGAQTSTIYQAGGNIYVAPEAGSSQRAVTPSRPKPSSTFPLDFQMRQAKERIRYLAYDYLKSKTLNLELVTGSYGDNVLDSPNLYDWPTVLADLERDGYIKITARTEDNIAFTVEKQVDQWQ
jgi:hypothetical protein